MKKNPKRLTLRHDTLRALTEFDLNRARGGAGITDQTCCITKPCPEPQLW